MSTLVALDVAILLPPRVREIAIALNKAISTGTSRELTLDHEHLPHITLTQQFVRVSALDACCAAIAEVVSGRPPMRLRVTGGVKGGSSVWMGIDRSARLAQLHERLMEAVEPFEQQGGGAAAFHGADARARDVRWVSRYRQDAAFDAFRPHVTIGHAPGPPLVKPMTFDANTIAACHLGRFCSCRRVFKKWTLGS